MSDDELRAAAWVRQGEWTIFLYPWHADPPGKGFERISEGHAADSVVSWFPIDDHHWYFTRDDLGRIFQRTTGIYGDLCYRKTTELRRWLAGALDSGEVRAYRWQEWFRLIEPEDSETDAGKSLPQSQLGLDHKATTSDKGPSPANGNSGTAETSGGVSAPQWREWDRSAETLAEYGTAMGIDLGTPMHPSKLDFHHISRIRNSIPYPAFVSSGTTEPLPNLTDETCPSPSWRSESVSTASPEVLAWFKKYDLNGNDPKVDRWNTTLGASGGGGFLRGSTHVVTLPAGQCLYRSFDELEKGAPARGGWWFKKPLRGDPRVFAALPDYCPGTFMARCRVDAPIEALEGLGAPRCSNKPGGPIQHCLPFVNVSEAQDPRIELF